MESSRGRLVAAVLTMAVLSACGSTVQVRSTLHKGSDELGSASAGDVVGEAATPASGPTAPSSSSRGPAPGGADTSGVPRTAGPSRSPSGVAAGPSGLAPGVTGRTIKVGVYTAQGYGDFTSALGTEIALGNQQVQARAVIDYLNAHGGVAGRKVVPVFHDADLASAAANPSQEYERACTSWTQDERVYAVVSPFGTTDDTLYECLSKAGVPIVNAGESRDSSFFQKYGPWYYQPTDMNLRRILSDNVDALHAAGFFGAHPRIAVLRADLPDEAAAVERGLKPALERHGLSLASSFAVPYDSSGGSAYYSSAVLRFQQERITHVLFAFYGSPLLFMIAAENQRYYPRYGLHSRSSPAALLQGAAPTAQQRGAMGIGWQPMNDVDSAHDPGVLNDRQALCLRLLKDAGEDTTNRATALVGLWICDNLFFLQDALRGAPTFMPAGLRAGAEALGAFRAASTFQSRLGPGRLHDGAASYRLFAFKDDCACYQYVSPEHSAP